MQPDASHEPDRRHRLAAVLDDFEAAMAERTALTVRIGRRVTQLVRISIFGLLILTSSMVYLVYTLATDVHSMTEQMAVMNAHMDSMEADFEVVAQRMQNLRGTVEAMTAVVAELGPLDQSVGAMRVHVAGMAGTVHTVSDDVGRMRGAMGRVSRDMGAMTVKLQQLEGSVFLMGESVNEISVPFRFFPN